MGVRALWESFNDTNERQKQALQDSDGKKGWISWRDMRAWYGSQELAQITRNAKSVSKTLARVPTQRDLKPFARIIAPMVWSPEAVVSLALATSPAVAQTYI